MTVASGGEAELLQEELRDLRSLAVHADHLRWVTRGVGSEVFDRLVRSFEVEWHALAEIVANCLVRRGVAPDGRASSLTHESYRGWLDEEWLDTAEAREWIASELEVLESWTHARTEQTEDTARGVLRGVEGRLRTQIDVLANLGDAPTADPG